MTVTSTVYLEVNSTPLHTYAWEHVDIGPLLVDAVRGSDEVMPGANGVRAFPRRRDAIEVSIRMEIIGDYDEDGAPIADPWSGVISNFLALKSALGIGLTTGDGTVPATLHTPSTTYSADVHVLGFPSASYTGGSILNTVLDLSIPSGAFTEDP